MEYFTISEIAEKLKVTPHTVRKWIRLKKLKGFRLSGTKVIRISEEEFNAFILSNEIFE